MGLLNELGLPRPPMRYETPESLKLQHDTAAQMREAVLDMMEFGVKGSDIEIPSSEDRSGVRLPALLRYSQATLHHYKTLFSVLDNPRPYQFSDLPESDWKNDKPDGDIILSREHNGDYYSYAHHFTAPYLNSLASALHLLESGHPALYVSTTRFNGIRDTHTYDTLVSGLKSIGISSNYPMRKFINAVVPNHYYNANFDGLWSTTYYFSSGISYNVFDEEYLEGNFADIQIKIGGSSRYDNPARTLLLKYFFAPDNLAPEDIIKHNFTRTIQAALQVVKNEKAGPYDGFNVSEIYFDSEKALEILDKQDEEDERSEVKYSRLALEKYALEKYGDQTFSIVTLGKKTINGVTYTIYTGSEGSMLQSREQSRIGSGVMKALFHL